MNVKQYSKGYSLLFISIFAALSLAPFLHAKEPIRSIEGTVIQVSDGDTIKVETVVGTVVKVRLYGIDAPETEKINRRTGEISKAGQPYGKEAHKALEAKVSGKNVTVKIIDIDRYKRIVGIIYLNGKDINLEMVKKGWAWAYREYLERPYASEYINAEAEARKEKLGIWKQTNPQPPWEFRKLFKL